MQYYRLTRILKERADYNIIFGERGPGKSFATWEEAVRRFADSGYKSQFAYIRRIQEDFMRGNAIRAVSAIVEKGVVKKLTRGKYDDIIYKSRVYYLCKRDGKGEIVDVQKTPFAFAFAISEAERYKSTAYPGVKTILFDEFLTDIGGEIPNEFIRFTDLLSTIIRERDDVQIFMLGNSINTYSTYFKEMGLRHAKDMKPGEIAVYEYNIQGLTMKLAIEMTGLQTTPKKSNKFFAFDNPKLNMIRGGSEGSIWQLDLFPHLREGYEPEQVIFRFFVIFDNETYQGDIVHQDNRDFIYFHRKTTPIRKPDADLIFSLDYDPRNNWKRSMLRPDCRIVESIARYFSTYSVYYQDNEVGQAIGNFNAVQR